MVLAVTVSALRLDVLQRVAPHPLVALVGHMEGVAVVVGGVGNGEPAASLAESSIAYPARIPQGFQIVTLEPAGAWLAAGADHWANTCKMVSIA